MVDYRKADAQFDADAAAAAAQGGSLRVKLPDKKEGELFGIADALVGGSRLEVMCEDGIKRLARIPGKMKRRMWIREGDLVIVKPWDFQNDKSDVVWRYTKTQAEYLSRKDMIPKQIDVFSGSSGGGP
jgi:translation initiation factor 1A